MRYLVLLLLVGCATGPEQVVPDTWQQGAGTDSPKDMIVCEGGTTFTNSTADKLKILFWQQNSCAGTYKYLTCGLSFAEACAGGYLHTKRVLEQGAQ